ncbi:hypothetical protein [Halocynthiibacter namhaensis]|uniref:hypothetical protein n=1 Tax=Halocynthiibacter namhaensis TaxID=1290553 RepID=UPI000579631A|nr:hypothetical protein [Halocynthiibacter namhaensis]
MSDFIETLITQAKEAATSEKPTQAIRALLQKLVSEPAALADAFDLDEETMLYEDENLSLWYTQFTPDTAVPPHEHKVNAHIAVFEGAQCNFLLKTGGDQLEIAKAKRVSAGEVLSLGPDGVHAVIAADDAIARGIHIYQGELSTIQRSLFDWETGDAFALNEANYDANERTSTDLPDRFKSALAKV